MPKAVNMDSMKVWIVLTSFMICCACISAVAVKGAKPCVKKDISGSGSFVCVCNSTYCDQVENSTLNVTSNSFNVFTTSETGDRLTKRQFNFSSTVNKSDDSVLYTLDKTTTFQSILGFGGAFTDSAAINILNVSQPVQDNLLKSYFSTEGIEYTIGRVPMASCDFSTHSYSYDDFANDFALQNFSLTNEDTDLKIPIIQRALAMSKRHVNLFGSPWSAPGWMKDSKEMKGKGQLLSDPGGKYYKTWAQYFVRFLQEYAKNGIPIWGLTIQNEPNAGYNPWLPWYGWQAMHLDSAMERDFLKLDLGPALKAAGYSNVSLMILDDNRSMLPSWVDTILNDQEAASFVSGIGIHWYRGSDYTVLNRTHANHPTKFILATEACSGYEIIAPAVVLGSWSRGEDYSHDILQDLNNYVSGWVDWNLALNLQGGPNWVKNFVDSPIIVDAEKDVFYKQPMFYHLGHFSKFVENGSKRINYTTDRTTKLESFIAQKPDSSLVAVFLNRKDTPISIHIRDPDNPHRDYINAQVPARSIQTYHWMPRSSKSVYKNAEDREDMQNKGTWRIWIILMTFWRRILHLFD